KGGKAKKTDGAWDLSWPDGQRLTRVVFTQREAQDQVGTERLTLENPRVRALAMGLASFVPGQPMPVVEIPGLPQPIGGFWSLWRISLTTPDWNRHRMMPLFLNDDGLVLMPT